MIFGNHLDYPDTNSDNNLFDVFFISLAPVAQKLQPPTNPEWVNSSFAG